MQAVTDGLNRALYSTSYRYIAVKWLELLIDDLWRDKRWPHLKIGLTCRPNARWNEYKRDDWQAIVMAYQTTSLSFARSVERATIEYARTKERALNYLWNERGGGGGPDDHVGRNHFVYLALCREE